MRILLTTVLAMTGACSAAADPAPAGGRDGERATMATPAPPAPAAEAIHRSEETDRIDYELAIPAEAAAIPALRDKLLADARSAKADILEQQAEFAREFPDAPTRTFGLDLAWRTRGHTDGLLVLVEDIYQFTGGAHGSPGTRPLIWDKRTDREVPLSALFTDEAAALATIRRPFCGALDRARAEKRGEPMDGGDSFTDCPDFEELTVVPAGNVGGRFSRILLIADPYVAGPYAEGEYEIELAIPRAMIPFVAPDHRGSFPG